MAVALLFTGLTRHPKIRRAGEAAGWLFVCCLEYTAEFGTDGFIPTDAVASFGLRRSNERVKKLLHQDDHLGALLHAVDGGYQIHDYLEWNRRAAALTERQKTKSAAKSRAGKKGAQVRWGSRLTPETATAANGKPDSSSDSKTMTEPIANEWQSDSPGSGSGSVSSSLRDPPPLSDARANGKTGGRSAPVADSVRRARQRATGTADPPLDGWDAATLTRICQQAAERHQTGHAAAYDRLLVLAAIADTRSPGRLLEPAGWELASTEQRRIAADAARRRRQDADDQARRAEHAQTTATAADRRATVAALAQTDPEGWQTAVQAATAAITGEGAAPLAPLVEARALAHYDQPGAPT